MFDAVLTDKPIPQILINALYRYYEQPQNEMKVGELYLLLKMIFTKLEDDLANKGMLSDDMMTPSTDR